MRACAIWTCAVESGARTGAAGADLSRAMLPREVSYLYPPTTLDSLPNAKGEKLVATAGFD